MATEHEIDVVAEALLNESRKSMFALPIPLDHASNAGRTMYRREAEVAIDTIDRVRADSARLRIEGPGVRVPRDAPAWADAATRGEDHERLPDEEPHYSCTRSHCSEGDPEHCWAQAVPSPVDETDRGEDHEAGIEAIARRLKATPHDMLAAEPHTVAKAIMADLVREPSPVDDTERLREAYMRGFRAGVAGLPPDPAETLAALRVADTDTHTEVHEAFNDIRRAINEQVDPTEVAKLQGEIVGSIYEREIDRLQMRLIIAEAALEQTRALTAEAMSMKVKALERAEEAEGLLAASPKWVVQILWDTQVDEDSGRTTEFWSPPIGPFYKHTEADKAATAIRKGLRKNGRPYHLRVKTSIMHSLDHALGWDQLS